MVAELAKRCKTAVGMLSQADTGMKNKALEEYAKLLEENERRIIEENKLDVDAARADGMTESLIDRLMLTPKRIAGMAGCVRNIAAANDPIGGSDGAIRHPNGMTITKRRTPLGVIGIIYEARPNVTADVVALCVKSGNTVLLRGGKAALRSNVILADLARSALESAGLPADCVCLITDNDRSSSVEMMGLSGLLDALIPRGGKGLIKSVVENAKVPVIETGWGNCHVYVDDEADLAMAERIVTNAKCSRPSVCNAAETLLVARSIARKFLPMAVKGLAPYNVRLHCCPESLAIIGAGAVLATEEDWETEYNDFDLAVRVVAGLDEAVAHITKYGSGHSEAIVTERYLTAKHFTERIDAAAVYVNVTTRYTDGEEFGLGAEMGVSTQKLHVRGPMGLEALTSTKYVIEGNGQIR